MHVQILGDSAVTLWGLGGSERLRRLAAALPGVTLGEPDVMPAEDPGLVVLRGDHLFDSRVLQALTANDSPLVLAADIGARVAAVRGPVRDREVLVQALAANDPGRLAGYPVRRPAEVAGGYQVRLRSHTPPRVHAITAERRRWLENELFADAYKGVTDLVTKWLWPAPARLVTRWAVAAGLRPNQVTLLSLALAVAAAVAFSEGAFAAGLAAGWLMTFLDTVDGKLARVTVTSSRFGDALDHGLDLIHPPLWYLAWGLGLGASWTLAPDLTTALWLIVAGYLGGRLCEGAFQLWLAPFSLFVWRPFDAFNRLVTARRNPNLILLTAGWAAGRPDLGLWAVMVWHLVSTLVLGVRLAMAAAARRRGPLRSWLSTLDPSSGGHGLAVRTFTRIRGDARET